LGFDLGALGVPSPVGDQGEPPLLRNDVRGLLDLPSSWHAGRGILARLVLLVQTADDRVRSVVALLRSSMGRTRPLSWRGIVPFVMYGFSFCRWFRCCPLEYKTVYQRVVV